MTKWEYATAPLIVHTTQAILNNWGEDGWELVTVLTGPDRRAGRLLQAPGRLSGAAEMGRVDERLTELGLSLPPVVVPVAAYTPAVIAGGFVWVSGQLPMVDGALPVAGRVGTGEGLVDPAEAARLARTCALNGLAAAASVLDGDLDRITRVVKLLGFVASSSTFTGQPQVINGASELLGEVFGEAGVHARSAVGVASLPLGSPVEVEMVFALA